jgi:hypothetical protein
MSLAALLFLLHRFPSQRRWLLPLGVLAEAYTVFEVLYLGTHTPTDVVVGFTLALVAFLTWRLGEHPALQPRLRALAAAPPATHLVLGLAVAAAAYALEVLEDALEAHTTHAADLQANYTAYCGLAPGTAADRMRNSSAYTKAALMLGLAVAWYLRRRLALGTGDARAPTWARVVRTAGGLALFSYTEHVVRAVAVPWIVPVWAGRIKDVPFAVQPLLLLVAAPLAAHVLGLGTYRRDALALKSKAT